MERTNTLAKVRALGHVQACAASRTLASLDTDGVTPPTNLLVCPLQAEEDDDGGDSNGRGPRRGKDEVVL